MTMLRLGWPGLAVLFLAGCGGGTALITSSDTTAVATYGNHALYPDEFLLEYERNAILSASGAKDTPEEFLDRLINYRLKVLEAEAAGYHEEPAVVDEIHSYRAAFARPYLVDRVVLAPILLDFYEKKKQIVHASHLFTRLQPEMSPTDTLRAYNRALALRDSVLQGMAFADVAELYSEDAAASSPDARQGYRGDLGWFTAGMMIKDFEDRAYTEPVGAVSEVFRSQYGYHVIKVHDRRPAIPSIRLSQILVRINGTAPESTAVARKKIEEARDRLDAGQNFAFVASELSEEANSRHRGGDVGLIRYLTRGLDSAFKEIAFNIHNVGDVTDIVHTGYGFQILKLTGRDTLGTYEDEFEDLRREARNLPRMFKAEEELTQSARSRYAASLDTLALTSLVGGMRRDSVRAYFSAAASDDSLGRIVIGHVADSTYTLRHLGRFTADRSNRILNEQITEAQAIRIGDAFLDYAAVTHAALDLEQTDEEFARIMQNFRDGLLLFKLMENAVWTAASEDTAALMAHYDANSDRYWFGDRHRIMEVFAYDDSLHKAAILQLDGGMSWADFYDYVRKDSVIKVRFDTVLVEGPTRSVYDRALGLEPGSRSEIIPYRQGFLALFYDGIAPARQKTFEEARAEVVSEYQALLEERLVARLRAMYNVKTYPGRARRAFPDR